MGSTTADVTTVAMQQQQQQQVGVAATGRSREGRNWSGTRTRVARV
jgi:hypothetical protein